MKGITVNTFSRIVVLGVVLAGLGVGGFLFIAQDSAAQAQDTFDRQAMLESIVNHVILPGFEAFVEESAALEAAINAFAADPSVETLEAAQAAWETAANRWEEVTIFSLGLRLMALHNQISKLPVNSSFIEDFIAGEMELNEAFIDSTGSTSKGLPAIEYLLFSQTRSSDDIVRDFTTGDNAQRRLQYLTALGENLHNEAQELYLFWSPDGENFAQDFIDADMEGGDVQGSINMLANEIFFYIENILQVRLGRPSGIISGGDPRPEMAESIPSGHSMDNMLHNLIGLQRLFNGGTEDEHIGFDDYLDFLGATYEGEPLSDVINARFDETIALFQAVEMPLFYAVEQEPEAIAEAYSSLRNLLIPVRVDMASHLTITITFTDADGDQ